MGEPLFVVMEGTDGSGTTTQGNLLADALRRKGRTVVRTAEPSDGPIGQVLRAVLKERTDRRMDPVAVALLFAADRVDHCARTIAPALQRGEWVVCDRYLGSSLAFQVVDGLSADATAAIDHAWVLAINRGARRADVSLLLDVPESEAHARIEGRGQPRERFEQQEFLGHVRRRYRTVFANPPPQLGRAVVIDAHRPREAVAQDVWAAAWSTAVGLRQAGVA